MTTMLPYNYFANLAQIVPEIPVESIVSRTLHNDDQVRVVLFAFAEGQELTEHTSTHAAMLHFVQGEADLTLGGDTLIAQTGTWVHMPPNLPHSIKAKTPLVMLLVMLKP